jgi:hypothetical protein
MEMSQGNSLYTYLKQTKNVTFILFTKSENRRAEQSSWGNSPFWSVVTSGSGEDVEKGLERLNIVQILYIHVCKWKNETC